MVFYKVYVFFRFVFLVFLMFLVCNVQNLRFNCFVIVLFILVWGFIILGIIIYGGLMGGLFLGFDVEKVKKFFLKEFFFKFKSSEVVFKLVEKISIFEVVVDFFVMFLQFVVQKFVVEKVEVKKEEKKLMIVQKIKKEVLYYWDGMKLLVVEVKISLCLVIKMVVGYELMWRE